jgi:hypothetical protein
VSLGSFGPEEGRRTFGPEEGRSASWASGANSSLGQGLSAGLSCDNRHHQYRPDLHCGGPPPRSHQRPFPLQFTRTPAPAVVGAWHAFPHPGSTGRVTRSMSSFCPCPKYVPLVAVRGVRETLRAFEDGGDASFAAFKRCWASSALPALLSGALQSAGALANVETSGALLRSNVTPAHARLPVEDSAQRTLCVQHLFVAASSFLAGMWGDSTSSDMGGRRNASGEQRRVVQTGALFTLFCIYFGQPEHARDGVPLTPASWKHLLELCEAAKQQMLARASDAATCDAVTAPAGAQNVASYSASSRGAARAAQIADEEEGVKDVELSDMRAAFAQLHAAGALLLSSTPTALEADSFGVVGERMWWRGRDSRDGWNGEQSVRSAAAHSAEQHDEADEREGGGGGGGGGGWVRAIRASNEFVKDVDEKLHVQKLDFGQLSCAMLSYSGNSLRLPPSSLAVSLRSNPSRTPPLFPHCSLCLRLYLCLCLGHLL